MKILFIYPNSGSQVGFNYGVSHLSAVLKRAGHHVTCWQLCEELAPLPAREEFTRRLRQEAADVIGFSVVTNQWPYTRQLAAWAREALSTPLVCGGIHATVAAREILETGLFDYVFRGECEEAFLEFVERTRRNQSLEGIRNLGLVHNGHMKINPVRPLPDLKQLPFKDYDIFDFQKMIDVKNGWVGLMASRGCPFSCSYCFNHQMVQHYKRDLKCGFKDLNYIRHFSVDQMISEIQHVQKNYNNIKMFIFDDDLFTFDKKYVRKFCHAYKNASEIPFVVNAHINYFDKDRAQHLADANCKIVKFGIESGSERIRRKVLKRYMSNKKMFEAIRIAKQLGLHTSIFLMIGLPFETLDDVMETIRFVARAKPGRFRWTFFYPFPGTLAHQLSVQGGYVNFAKMQSLMNFTESSCLDFGTSQNLFLKKLGLVFPWFVNAYSDLPVAPFYLKKVNEILAMDEEKWLEISPSLPGEDKALSERFVREGLSHYAIKYNAFMGVISDYFVRDEL